MRLISLNTWGGKIFEPLINFIRQHSQETDIFCFQEIYDTSSDVKQYKNLIRANLLDDLKNILKDFQVFYFPTLFGFDDQADKVNFELKYGSAIFVKNSIEISSQQNYFIYKDRSLNSVRKNFSNLATPLQRVSFSYEDKQFSVFNFHGTPFPAHKLDTLKRLRECLKVKKIIEEAFGVKILVGDFNLLPQSQSIKMFEANMINLIKKFEIERTRSRLSSFYGGSDFQKFADYTFVTPEVVVSNFNVPKVVISDHLPMILQFM